MSTLRLVLFLFFLLGNLFFLHGETTLPVPATSLDTGFPGNDPPGYRFTLDDDGLVTIKAMFMTHWLTNRSHVVSNPKATRFIIDGKAYPSNEDFYGYMDGRVWPERTVQSSQQIWIEETVQLSKGSHLIEFHNGLMERDSASSSFLYSYTNWMTASLNGSFRLNSLDIKLFPTEVTAAVSPKTQTITTGQQARFELSAKGNMLKFTGTDGLSIADPGDSQTVSPALGNYIYSLSVTGTTTVLWNGLGSSTLWIETPTGDKIDASRMASYVATVSGYYTFRLTVGATTESSTLYIDLPTAVATATLAVIPASPSPTGPVITGFTPITANYTVTSGPATGHTYGRSWQSDGVWTAYLGRDGVAFKVTGHSNDSSVERFEIQAKAPSGDWYTLATTAPASTTPKGPGVDVTGELHTRLGEVRADKPLLPADVSLAGTWSIRARVSDAAGNWSPWAFEQPLRVIMPIQDLSLPTRTLPPVQDSEWFVASPTQVATFHVVVP